MLQGIGTWEILLIFLVLLLMFGAKRIPEIARGLGKGVTEFKRAVRDVKDEIETGVDTNSAPSTPVQSETQSSDAEKKVES